VPAWILQRRGWGAAGINSNALYVFNTLMESACIGYGFSEAAKQGSTGCSFGSGQSALNLLNFDTAC
jgi:hypothetical protein